MLVSVIWTPDHSISGECSLYDALLQLLANFGLAFSTESHFTAESRIILMVSVCVWRKREVKSVKVTGLEWKIDCSSRIGARPQSAQGLVWSQVSFSALTHQHLAISLFLIWIVISLSMTMSNIMIVWENAWLSGWSPSPRGPAWFTSNTCPLWNYQAQMSLWKWLDMYKGKHLFRLITIFFAKFHLGMALFTKMYAALLVAFYTWSCHLCK